MKKLIIAVLSLVFAFSLFCGCSPDNGNQNPGGDETGEELPDGTDWSVYNLDAGGFVEGKIGDFSEYENTSAYRKVSTAEELLQAIVDAQYHYKNVWDENTSTYTQVPADGYTEENFKGTVHVIEIENDLNLGYKKLSATAIASGIVSNYDVGKLDAKPLVPRSDMYIENGITQIKVENISDLLVYSKNGAKLTHCGFKLSSDTNVVFRNLQFDEMWQWEDISDASANFAAGDYDLVGWAYFKISNCGYIWIDHCTFGKSYDGNIDYSDTDYTANSQVAGRAPYGADGGNGLHISWCQFNAGSDDPDGYIYKMMAKIEEEYQEGKQNYCYYNALREAGAEFEDILYALAIPQKKAFLCGDSKDEQYAYNLTLKISLAYTTFRNIEDRIPKIRGGNGVMYNCVVDNSKYYEHRTNLKNLNYNGVKDAKNIVQNANSNWKCALTSQGFVCGNGGSIYSENCIFRGIEYLLKNNDSSTLYPTTGGYKIVNCSYDRTGKGTPYVGSSSDAGHEFRNDSASVLTPENFSWHTPDGEQPFEVPFIELDELESFLADGAYGAGTGAFEFSLLKSTY